MTTKIVGIILAVLLLVILLSIVGIICFVLWVFIFHDEVEEFDNSDGHITCSLSGKSCIKGKLYSYCNNCSECPIQSEYGYTKE